MMNTNYALGQVQFAGKTPRKSMIGKIGGALAGAALLVSAGTASADKFVPSAKPMAEAGAIQKVQAAKPGPAQLQTEFADRFVDLMNLVVKLAQDEKQPEIAAQFERNMRGVAEARQQLGDIDFSKPLSGAQKSAINAYTQLVLRAVDKFGGVFDQHPEFFQRFVELAFQTPDSELFKAREAVNEAYKRIQDYQPEEGEGQASEKL